MEAYIGMINAFGFTYAPQNWVMCQGQLMSIAQFSAVFALLGTTYGGNGQTTFGLPDLRGRSAVGMGQGPGLSNWVQGQTGGSENVVLTSAQLPMHSHTAALTAPTYEAYVQVSTSAGNKTTPSAGDYMAGTAVNRELVPKYIADAQKGTTVAIGGVSASASGGSVAVGNAGNSTPFSVLSPRLALNYCICVMGIFPPRND